MLQYERRSKPSSGDCPCAGITLDKLIRPAILAVLAHGPLHGYRVAQRIGDIPTYGDQKPDISGVYRLLKTMEKSGLLVSSWEEVGNGPARKIYETTPSGAECLHWWVRTLGSYRVRISALLKVAREAERHSG